MAESKKELWLEELANFIVEANKNTWAGEGGEVPARFRDGTSLYYRKGEWELEDDYTGYFSAPGMTRVLYKGRSVWTMAYFGAGQLGGEEHLVKDTFQFLKRALMRVTPEMPFRGPGIYNEDNWRYNFRLLRGAIVDFIGREAIYHNQSLVFTQTVGGGIVRHKDEKGEVIAPWAL
ncbi:MAG: DUF5680 domain-containing protein [Nanoarchaeota archaeon]